MRIIQLIYLLDLYKTRSLSKTANNFFVSRQTINYDLKKLEETYSITLYQFKNNVMEFTDEGELMVRKAKAIIDAYSDFEKVFPNKIIPANQFAGNIEIIATPRMANSLLPSFLKSFLKQYPHIKVSFNQRKSSDIINTVGNIPNQLGIITSLNHDLNLTERLCSLSNQKNIEIMTLVTMDFYVCVSKDGPWADIEYFTLDEIQNESNNIPLIGYKDLIPEFDQGNLHYTYTVSDIHSQQQFIDENLGIGLITSAEYNLFYKNKMKYLFKPFYYSVENKEKVDYSYVLLANRYRSEQENLFISHFQKFLAKYK